MVDTYLELTSISSPFMEQRDAETRERSTEIDLRFLQFQWTNNTRRTLLCSRARYAIVDSHKIAVQIMSKLVRHRRGIHQIARIVTIMIVKCIAGKVFSMALVRIHWRRNDPKKPSLSINIFQKHIGKKNINTSKQRSKDNRPSRTMLISCPTIVLINVHSVNGDLPRRMPSVDIRKVVQAIVERSASLVVESTRKISNTFQTDQWRFDMHTLTTDEFENFTR